ncbi:hypothetical protein SH611_03160 [Geminicoccaceae bacterium 1502E]|nr:hypothetical protein [Geminicoccaceae bacterium 1502E]
MAGTSFTAFAAAPHLAQITGADPHLEWRRRYDELRQEERRISRSCRTTAEEIEAEKGPIKAIHDEMATLEDRICRTPATTPAGAIEQLRMIEDEGQLDPCPCDGNTNLHAAIKSAMTVLARHDARPASLEERGSAGLLLQALVAANREYNATDEAALKAREQERERLHEHERLVDERMEALKEALARTAPATAADALAQVALAFDAATAATEVEGSEESVRVVPRIMHLLRHALPALASAIPARPAGVGEILDSFAYLALKPGTDKAA